MHILSPPLSFIFGRVPLFIFYVLEFLWKYNTNTQRTLIISVHLDEFSQSEHSPVTSTPIKIQDISSLPEAHPVLPFKYPIDTSSRVNHSPDSLIHVN